MSYKFQIREKINLGLIMTYHLQIILKINRSLNYQTSILKFT